MSSVALFNGELNLGRQRECIAQLSHKQVVLSKGRINYYAEGYYAESYYAEGVR